MVCVVGCGVCGGLWCVWWVVVCCGLWCVLCVVCVVSFVLCVVVNNSQRIIIVRGPDLSDFFL